MKAGVAKREITPDKPVRLIIGLDSTGVHDPLFARALVLDDGETSVAIVAVDVPTVSFELAERANAAVTERTGIALTLINATHTHSGIADENTLFAMITEAVAEAHARRVPASLHAGRAPVQIGFNRRITDASGQVSMGTNPDGPVVPWVNVLLARTKTGNGSGEPGKALAVLFEHAAHPVIVHSSSSLISGDFPAHAVDFVENELGDGVTAMFAQGCGANINGDPIASGHANAILAGNKLGAAVLEAVTNARKIEADTLEVRTGRVMLPTQPLPSLEILDQTRSLLETDYANGTESGKPVDWVTEEVHRDMVKMLDERREMIVRGEQSLPRRFEASAVMIGTEWCLVTMHDEMFCEYELWVDRTAPFEYTMTFGYTNGGSGYIADDASLALGEKGGYEAGTYPCWWSHGPGSVNRNTPAVGTEELIRQCVAGLWS